MTRSRRKPDAQHSLADPPSDVQVTIVTHPHGRRAIDRMSGRLSLLRPPVMLALTIGMLASGAFVAQRLGRSRHAPAPVAASRLEAPPPAADAYRYPLGCLGAKLAGADLGYRERNRHRGPCWRYGVYVTAIFDRVNGVWGLALEATSSSCPAMSLPAEVKAQLARCSRQRDRR